MGKDYSTKFIGLDVHKDSITIAIADGGRDGEVRLYGAIENTTQAIDKIIRKILSTSVTLQFVYEAGPCGFGLYRHLKGNGFNCMVTAPSTIPKRAGVRLKNDNRDAITLARLLRAGELTAIYVPDPEDEAVRDLTRAREDSRIAERKARQRLNSFLLRNDFIFSGKRKWTKAHYNWLSDLKMPHRVQQVAFQEYLDAVNECSQRILRINEQIHQVSTEWRWAPTVKALQALRGISLLAAVITVAEIGDLSRFQHPKELMAFLGLVPSEHSSGNSIKRGGITKTGNSHARRICVESAWTYRYPARLTRYLLKRQEGLPANIRQIAWKAQLRLCTRFKKMRAREKPAQVVVVAIARELVAFIWAIAQQVEAPA
ncbi:MAG: IS110 family RNA-guided transposase [Planctomycetota bacterium]|jgi:transposase